MEGRIDFRALVMGVLTHLATALVVGMVSGLVLHWPLLSRFFNHILVASSAGKPLSPAQSNQLATQMTTELQGAMTTPPALVISVAVGLLALLAGGYVTAKYASGAERKNALALGGAYAAYNALGAFVTLAAPAAGMEMPLWPQIVLMLLAVPVTMLGATLRVSEPREKGAPPNDIS